MIQLMLLMSTLRDWALRKLTCLTELLTSTKETVQILKV